MGEFLGQFDVQKFERFLGRLGLMTWGGLVFYIALIALDAPVPKPAFASDLNDVKAEVSSLKEAIKEGQSAEALRALQVNITVARTNLQEIQREIRAYQRDGVAVPDFLINAEGNQKAEIDDLVAAYNIKLRIHEERFGDLDDPAGVS